MPDALVSRLNELGYQAVFLPVTDVESPEIYCAVDGRLLRYGPLVDWIRSVKVAPFKPVGGEIPDLKHVHTSSKKFSASLKFMQAALRCLGASFAPDFGLSSLREKKLLFSISGVTFSGVSPGLIERVLGFLDPALARKAGPSGGQLHIVHEYLYASKLLIHSRVWSSREARLKLSLEEFSEVETNARITQEDDFTIAFSHPEGKKVACAYRAGWLRREGDLWNFLPNVIVRATTGAEQSGPYIPSPGQTLWVEPDDETPRA